MPDEKKPDLTADRWYPCGWGFVFRVVCCPASWSNERLNDAVSRDDPPGTSVNRWEVSEPRERDDAYNGINQLPCPDDPDRIHWLMNC